MNGSHSMFDLSRPWMTVGESRKAINAGFLAPRAWPAYAKGNNPAAIRMPLPIFSGRTATGIRGSRAQDTAK
jgi:hypothetical protein